MCSCCRERSSMPGAFCSSCGHLHARDEITCSIIHFVALSGVHVDSCSSL